MGRVNHHLVAATATFRQFEKDAPEHAQRAPADEAVVDCLAWTLTRGQVAPPNTVVYAKDDAPVRPAVIYRPNPMRERKERRNSRGLVIGQQDYIGHGGTPSVPQLDPCNRAPATNLIDPEPQKTCNRPYAIVRHTLANR